ncbi:uncharacterized protein J8A68_004158 [[Candida] subhashii]|uniref:Phospholipid/glycerol acyltransferase domain-containing protein n=1 Tax=[Candida] subhashii TaxID=561895 RepID=A0A8J5Q6Q3_9ASCO|nr:uncharacterized protein J8A68_004158 [[Candida] subhashii]KAG7662264.1 hypothetical protein J8A68_004158 [[Candida] subhashii]
MADLMTLETTPTTTTTNIPHKHDMANSDFDVNILEDAFDKPSIDLTFPLPTDKETYLDISTNEKLVGRSFSLLHNAFRFLTGSKKYDAIYKDNEYRYFLNRHSPGFKTKFKQHLNDKLETKDEKLNELIYELINQELNLKLIKPSEFKSRFDEVKNFMINHYKLENKKNLPTFESHDFIRTAYCTVIFIMKKLFPKGIWVSNQELSNLFQKYLENPMSIVFFPSHQSHLDYIIVHLICVRFRIAIPSVIAGDNMNVAIVGEFLKNLGAIFIPRSFNNELYTERNLHNVIEFLLANKSNFEVFIEGGRSRDGKLLLPKYGILKSLVHSYLNQRIIEKNHAFDLLFQPMAVTYERVYENDSYLKELTGEDKKQESLFGILSVGLSVFRNQDTKLIYDQSGYNDNSARTLTGKIFVKLGDNFKLSNYMQDEENLSLIKQEADFQQINLKKLGFKILHEINRSRFLPEISLIGTALQAYYYLEKKEQFDIKELIPIIRLITITFLKENQDLKMNKQILEDFQQLSDEKLVTVAKREISSFFRYIKVNKNSDLIKIESPLELLYYKNLTIHSIIKRCLVSFILLLLDENNSECSHRLIAKLFYICTGFLKTEFLFDHDENPRNGLTFILNDMVNDGILTKDQKEYNHITYKIIDRFQFKLFANLARPFLESYNVLISNILTMTQSLAINYSKNLANGNGNGRGKKKIILDDNDLKYPDTKGLLKHIIAESRKAEMFSVESVNKQYLLSNLYYLHNLRLINIFKNKAKTKAFVQIINLRDLKIVNEFLCQLIKKSSDNDLIINEVKVNYIIDITDKNYDRDYNEIKSNPKL